MARKIKTLTDAGRQEIISVLGETNGGTGQSSFAIGDILYSDGYDSLDRLPIGTDGYVLTLIGGLPVWALLNASNNTKHNDLDGIQGGNGNDAYYHLDEDEWDFIVDGYANGWTAATGWKEEWGGTGEINYTTGDLLVGDGSNGLTKLASGSDGEQLTITSAGVAWEEGYYNALIVGKPGILLASTDGYLLTNLALASDDSFPAMIMPIQSTLKQFRVQVGTPPGSGEDVTVTIRYEGSDTSLTLTISDSATTATDTTTEQIALGGKPIDVRVITSSGCAAENISVVLCMFPNHAVV